MIIINHPSCLLNSSIKMILFLILKRLALCAPEFSIIFSLVKASTLVPAKSLIFLLCGEIEFLQDLSCTQLPASAAKALLLQPFCEMDFAGQLFVTAKYNIMFALSNFTFLSSHSKKGQDPENTTAIFSICFYRSIPLNPKEDIMRVMIFDLIR